MINELITDWILIDSKYYESLGDNAAVRVEYCAGLKSGEVMPDYVDNSNKKLFNSFRSASTTVGAVRSGEVGRQMSLAAKQVFEKENRSELIKLQDDYQRLYKKLTFSEKTLNSILRGKFSLDSMKEDIVIDRKDKYALRDLFPEEIQTPWSDFAKEIKVNAYRNTLIAKANLLDGVYDFSIECTNWRDDDLVSGFSFSIAEDDLSHNWMKELCAAVTTHVGGGFEYSCNQHSSYLKRNPDICMVLYPEIKI